MPLGNRRFCYKNFDFPKVTTTQGEARGRQDAGSRRQRDQGCRARRLCAQDPHRPSQGEAVRAHEDRGRRQAVRRVLPARSDQAQCHLRRPRCRALLRGRPDQLRGLRRQEGGARRHHRQDERAPGQDGRPLRLDRRRARRAQRRAR